MYCNIKYKYEVIGEASTSLKEKYPNLFSDLDDFNYIESYLEFQSEEDLDIHIEKTKEKILKKFNAIVVDIEVERISSKDFLKRKELILKLTIVKKYMAALGIMDKGLQDELRYLKDDDFVIKAYSYLLEFLSDDGGLII